MGSLLNNELKANAQAGAVNISANDLSVNFGKSDKGGAASFPECFIRNARRAFNPIKAVREETELRSIEANSVSDVVAIYRKTFPTFSDEQLFLLAHGYNMSAAQADNVLNVLGRPGAMSKASRYDELPESSIDLDICGAQTAYDDELRFMWAKLISQEVSTGVPRSKRTKALLEQMDVEDANQLLSVLKCCLWSHVGPQSILTPIPVLFKTSRDDSWTYNGGMISTEAVRTLDSLGVLSSGVWVTFTLKPGNTLVLTSSSHRVSLTNDSGMDQTIELGEAKFLKLGIELAEVINAPTEPTVLEIMKDKLEVDVSWVTEF